MGSSEDTNRLDGGDTTAPQVAPDERDTVPHRSKPLQAVQGVGAYRLERLLGTGGMGAVYQAGHRVKPGTFAVKLLKPGMAHDPGFRRRFEREARVGVALEHPNIVDVQDFVVDGERLALVMEYVQGETLTSALVRRDTPLPWAEAVAIFRPILLAMTHAHARGVIHRDLKPGNVMITSEGEVKVTDFGIAFLTGGQATASRFVLGTAEYMAPECVASDDPPTERSDIYSLGMTLYRMVAGRLPFDAGTARLAVVKQKQQGDLAPPSRFVPGLPPGIDELVCKALEVEPADRFASCIEMLAMLEDATRRPRAAPAGDPGKTEGNRALLALAALVIVVVGGWLVVPGLLPEVEDAPQLGPREIPLEVGEDVAVAPTATPAPTAAPSTGAKPRPAPVEPKVGAILEHTGTLRVVAVPGARVLQGRAEIGHASPGGAAIPLEPGVQRVRFICADSPECADFLRRSVVEQFEVVAGEEVEYRVHFGELNPR